MNPSPELKKVFDRIDAANSQDPIRILVDGSEQPFALIYGKKMSEWLSRLVTDASDALEVAVRAQHLMRFKILRSSYPMDRIGYLKWRTDLAKFHAEEAGKILEECGYDAGMKERVAALIKKERIKADPEAQALEDAACLTFLELEYVAFIAKHSAEKVISILQKTWGKMSTVGHAAARELAGKLSPAARELLSRALGE